MARRKITCGGFNGDLDRAVAGWLGRHLREIEAVYKDIHAHPELSGQEKRTSKVVAGRLRAAGCKVIERIGGYGVAGVMHSGVGPTVLVRADMDALPVTEETGLPYASRVKGVMHACGHDLHSATLTAVAAALGENKGLWNGRIVFIGQPDEETASGARAMIRDGLFRRVPRPQACLGLHVEDETPAGSIGIVPGWFTANTDSIDITIRGRGGHGARPHEAEDPIVAAAQVIMALQTIVTRRVDPIEPVVITVGSIHAGQKHNIIPDRAKMQLTVRTFSRKVRQQVLRNIKTVTADAARAAGCTAAPEVNIGVEYTAALYNDPELAAGAGEVFANIVGARRVVTLRPTTGGEDFSVFVDNLGVPGLMYNIGAAAAGKPKRGAGRKHVRAPLHSSRFAPVLEPTLGLAVRSMCALVGSILKGG
jgi:hippurate hydrolase